MAIDLFVNFERYSNNSLFYRVTSASPSTFTVKLSDEASTNSNLDALYYVEYSLNGQAYTQFQSNFTGEFIMPLVFNTTRPCVCSIAVGLTSIDSRRTSNFAMQGKFVSRLPSIDFIAYPSLFVDIDAQTQTIINSSNYLTESRGLVFYGEGHTEVINLSSNNTNYQINWLVGNQLFDIVEQKYINSFYPVTLDSGTGTTARVSIFTQSNKQASIPISVWATNEDITTNGPVIKYNDFTGLPEYYPFFTSSITPDGNFTENNLFKSNVNVAVYPNFKQEALNNPFEESTFLLPLDYSTKTFNASVKNSKLFGSLIKEEFIKTQWYMSADVRKDSKMIGWSSSTEELYGCKAYQFGLGYQPESSIDYNLNILPFYKTSIEFPTTITLAVSTTKTISINAANDWIPREVTFVNTVTAGVGSVPSSKIYSSKYFYVKGETATFTMVNVPPDPYIVLTAMLSSEKSADVLFLTTDKLSGTMAFNVLGPADITAWTTYFNTKTEKTYNTHNVYTDVVEIVKMYDEIPNEEFFHTEATPLYLPYTSQPKISPNEWVTADIINSITKEIYSVAQTLYDYTSIYARKDKFYAYMMPRPKQLISEVDGVLNSRVLTWLDTDCTDSNSIENSTWADLEEVSPENTWGLQSTNFFKTSDPACLQKHCLRWNWKWRKKGKSEIDVTWKDARCKGQFAKKWKYEKCVIDTTVECNYVNWQTSTDRKQQFIIPTSRSHNLCPIVDVDVLYSNDHLVLARTRELYIVKKNYQSSFVDRMFMADDLFTFQSIVGITTTKDEKIIVLDKLLPRVSVYEFINNDIILTEAWGKYGQQKNPLGLNQPTDIHVDDYSTLWIADNGNNCVKKFTLLGKPLGTLTHAFFDAEGITSVCVDSTNFLHCLTSKRVVVFDKSGNYAFNYILPDGVTKPTKINTSYNRETVYISFSHGVVKYFRTGIFSHFVLQNIECADGGYLQEFNSISQDKFRSVYVTAGDKLLQIQDIQQRVQLKAPVKSELYWKYSDLLIHKEEYIQPWVYLKSFHRLWDNIELLRSSIFYSTTNSCKAYVPPVYAKEDLIIGQNEIVTNSIINRLTEQLWTNLQTLLKYYDPDCKN